MRVSKKYSVVSLIVIVALAFALIMTSIVVSGMSVTANADTSNGSVYTPLSVTGFDADVVADDESWSDGMYANNSKYVDVTEYTLEDFGHVFASDVFCGSDGFPAGQTITTSSGKKYTLQSSTSNNALQLAATSGFTTKTLTLTTPGSYDRIGILSTGGGGEVDLIAVVEYSDGTTSSNISVSSPDWYGGDASLRVYGPISRVSNQEPGYCQDAYYYLFETTIDVDPDKAVSSITFTFDSDNNAVANIFAISGMAAELKHTVTFDLNGHGDAIPAIQKVSLDDKVTMPSDPQTSGYTFGGWYKESACENEWDFATDTVSENITLFAKWTEGAQSSAHVHDDVTFTAWESATSLPTSAGNYYLTSNVTISGTWTKPGGDVNLCLNGYGIRTTSGRVITMNGGTLNLYDCGDTTHYFDVSDGKAVNVNTTSGSKSFTGGYITGGSGQAGLSYTAYYWGEAGGILVWSGTFNMYGGTILGNSAASGGGVEVVNATMNMYGGSISYNSGAGVNLRATGPAVGASEKGTATLNMYGGSISYNKGIGVHDSYGWYGNRAFNLYGGTISHNTNHGIWVESTTNITGDPTIEGNGGNGVLAHTLTLEGSPVIRDNGSGDFRVASDKKIVITDALNCQPMSVFMQNDATGVFTSGWSTYMTADPTTYFYAYNSDEYHVENEEGEAKMVAGGVPITIHVHNLLQGTVKDLEVYRADTVADTKAAAAAEFGVTAANYKLTYDGEAMTETDTLKQCGVMDGDSLTLLPIKTDSGLKTLTLVPTLTIEDKAEVAPGVYSSIRQGDTITITYKSIQNSGFSDAVFTTAFNENYFHLTGFTVDDTYYSLLDDYGRDVGGTYLPMTLAEHIADHNASLDAGETPYTARLSFFLTYKGGLFDTEGVLSDHFITVTYTAVQDIPAGMAMNFGFDMRLDGLFTNAAYDDEVLLFIMDAEGNEVDDKMVTIMVKEIASIDIVEDQTLTFKRNGNAYIVDPADIEINWTAPVFTETNPYLADGGAITYTFYTKNGNNEYEALDGVPTAVGDYYVKATLSETDKYLGYETDYVAITVARRQVAVPDLKLYAGEDSETPTYAEGKLSIAAEDVTYGTTLTLKEIVNAAESVYAFDCEDFTYTFTEKDGDEWNAVSNFFNSNSQPLPVGTYKLTITVKNSDYVEFDADPAVNSIVISITIVKAKVVAPTETAETYTYTGAEQTYEFATAGSSALYTVSNDKRTVAGEQDVTVAINDKDNYEWANGGDTDLSFTFTIGKAKVVAPTETAKTYTYSGDVLTYIFATAGSDTLYSVSDNTRVDAGEQDVTVAINDKDNYEWENGGVADLTFTFTVAPKALNVTTLIDGVATKNLTYGDAAPIAALFTCSTDDIVEGDDEDAIYAVLSVVEAETAYAQYSPVGEYIYTTVKTGDLPANYTLGDVTTAKIVVDKKALTLSIVYNGNTATFSVEGVVNGDVVTYSVGGESVGNTYTATAADLGKSNVAVSVSGGNNYESDSDVLKVVYSVTFAKGEGFDAAANMPEAQYIFAGEHATAPAGKPTIENYEFKHWYLTDAAVAYVFSSAINENTILTAAWEQTTFLYKFRAILDGADLAVAANYRALKWENDAFVFATTAEAFTFTNKEAISMNATIGVFRVDHWLKAVMADESYEYTLVYSFESDASVDVDENAYYIAVMKLDLGKGDLNGDGALTAEDILMMKKYLVGTEYENTFTNVTAAWNATTSAAAPENAFYVFLWDSNGDGYKDTRDVLTSRMALATGYAYEIKSDVTVNGVYYAHDVVVTPTDTVYEGAYTIVTNEREFVLALTAGRRVALGNDVSLVDSTNIKGIADIDIELGGYTLTMPENAVYQITSHGDLTIKNGEVVIGAQNITLQPIGGKVTIENIADQDQESINLVGETNQSVTILGKLGE